MPIYELPSDPIFPHPSHAQKDGLLAYGGDLSSQRLEVAYRHGIFPWYDEYSPDILWWSPPQRMILFPDQFKLSKSLRQKIKRNHFEIRIDSAFKEVIKACQSISRKGQDGTWILDDMLVAYYELHKQGYAHSVECWRNDKLVGGLYGLSFGNAFFGESMFHKESDASKVAFYYLCEITKDLNLDFIDCQMHTDHLESLGAQEILRDQFLEMLATSNKMPTHKGSWEKLASIALKS